MSLDDELISKGLARDIIRHVQAKRKDLNLDVEASIELSVWIESREQLLDNDWSHIQIETRAGNAHINSGDIPDRTEYFEVDGIGINFLLRRFITNYHRIRSVEVTQLQTKDLDL